VTKPETPAEWPYVHTVGAPDALPYLTLDCVFVLPGGVERVVEPVLVLPRIGDRVRLALGSGVVAATVVAVTHDFEAMALVVELG
jgi:hypothetical protein